MRLYEIDQAIAALVDPETGELMDYEAFEALALARDEKLENMALWYKDLCAEATAIKSEIANLAERKKSAESKAENLKRYLDTLLAGSKFKTARCDISSRESTAVEIADESAFVSTADNAYLVPQPPKIDRTAITFALKNGAEISGATLVKRNNIQIK